MSPHGVASAAAAPTAPKAAIPSGKREELDDMATPIDFVPGGYRFIPAVFQYSAGVAALAGYEIRRIRFRRPVALSAGFDAIEQIITAAGRPPTAFCACELRSPAPFTEQGFRAFNEVYVVRLGKWGIFDGTGAPAINPVARSNVCPQIDPPGEPSFHAFSFTTAAPGARPSFVASGSGEAVEGQASYRDRIIRRGDTGPDGLREKARYVLGEMEARMAALGFGWADTTATQVYTVYYLSPFLADEVVRRGAAHAGLTWHFCRPPVVELDYEMDCRSVRIEGVL